MTKFHLILIGVEIILLILMFVMIKGAFESIEEQVNSQNSYINEARVNYFSIDERIYQNTILLQKCLNLDKGLDL